MIQDLAPADPLTGASDRYFLQLEEQRMGRRNNGRSSNARDRPDGQEVGAYSWMHTTGTSGRELGGVQGAGRVWAGCREIFICRGGGGVGVASDYYPNMISNRREVVFQFYPDPNRWLS